jgi:hypothetical protein
MFFSKNNPWPACLICLLALSNDFVASQTSVFVAQSNFVLGSAENRVIVLDSGSVTTLLKVKCESGSMTFLFNSQFSGTVNMQIGDPNRCRQSSYLNIINGTDSASITTDSATSSYCRTYEVGSFGEPDRYIWQTAIDVSLQLNRTASARYRTTANFSCEWTPRRDAVINGDVTIQLLEPFNPQAIKTIRVIPTCIGGGAVQLKLDSPFSGHASIQVGSDADNCQVDSSLEDFSRNYPNAYRLTVNLTTPFGSGASCGRQIVNDLYIWNVTISQRVRNPPKTLEHHLEYQFGISCPYTSSRSSVTADQDGVITVQRDDPNGRVLALTTVVPVCQTGGSVDLIVRTMPNQGNVFITVGSTSSNESCSVVHDSLSVATTLTTTGGPGSPCGRTLVKDPSSYKWRYFWNITVVQSGKAPSENFSDTFILSCSIRVTVIDSEGILVEADDHLLKPSEVMKLSSTSIPEFAAIVRAPIVFV